MGKAMHSASSADKDPSRESRIVMKTAMGLHDARYRIRLRPLLSIGCTSALHFHSAHGYCSADYQTLRRVLRWMRLVIVPAQQGSQAALNDPVWWHHKPYASHDCKNIEIGFASLHVYVAKIKIEATQNRAECAAHKTV